MARIMYTTYTQMYTYIEDLINLTVHNIARR